VDFRDDSVKGLQIRGQTEQRWAVDGGSFTNNTDWTGGALSVISTSASVSRISLTNLEFRSNRAREGGALYLQVHEANVSSTVFAGNVAKMQGGAVYAYSGTHLRSIESNFSGNIAQTQNGGSVCVDSTERADLRGNRFKDNRAKLRGGAVYAKGLNLTVVGPGSFANNSAGLSGGGLYMGYIDPANSRTAHPIGDPGRGRHLQ
jgi:predicted outer membrane repeat protein